MRKNNELISYKSNVLIQNYAWNFNQFELDIFEFLCCCYETNYYDADNNTIKISLHDFAKELNEYSMLAGGRYYNLFENAIKKLADTSIWVWNDKGNAKSLLRIINNVIIEYDETRSGAKYFNLLMSDAYKEHLSKHPLGNTLIKLKILRSCSSKYSKRFYNLIHSWKGREEVVLDIAYLREDLQCNSSTYNNISKLKDVIDYAINEVCELTNINVTYEPVKHGKKVVAFKFYIKTKTENKVLIDEPYQKTPLEITVASDEEKQQYYYEWLEYHFPYVDEYDNFDSLFSVIPESVHQYSKDKALAIQNVAGSRIISLSDEFDNEYNTGYYSRTASIIRNFVRRKWNNNLKEKVEKNEFSYFLKSFEYWCEEQFKIRCNEQAERTVKQNKGKLKGKPSFDVEKLKEAAAKNENYNFD